MAQKYRKVDPRIWTDERFKRLTLEGKILVFWLLTGGRINRCGIVQWSTGLASEETGIKYTVVDTVLDTVCDTLNWVRDRDANLVFLTRWWRYNRPDNSSALAGALSDLHDLPANRLKPLLVKASEDIGEPLRAQYLRAVDTVYPTVSDTVSYTVSPQEQEQEQEHKDPPNPPRPGGTIPSSLDTPAFREAWATWLAERRARKVKPYTARGEQQQLAKLAVFGPEEAIRAIQESIAQGWQGLFPKQAANGRPKFETQDERNMREMAEAINHARSQRNEPDSAPRAID